MVSAPIINTRRLRSYPQRVGKGREEHLVIVDFSYAVNQHEHPCEDTHEEYRRIVPPLGREKFVNPFSGIHIPYDFWFSDKTAVRRFVRYHHQ